MFGGTSTRSWFPFFQGCQVSTQTVVWVDVFLRLFVSTLCVCHFQDVSSFVGLKFGGRNRLPGAFETDRSGCGISR